MDSACVVWFHVPFRALPRWDFASLGCASELHGFRVEWSGIASYGAQWSGVESGSGVSGVEWREVERNGAICVEMELAWSGLDWNGAEWSAGTWTGAYMGHV